MQRLTAATLVCTLSFAVQGRQAPDANPSGKAWVERSNTYTNTLLEVEFAHTPESGSQQGLARFEVLGRNADRALIRSLAKKLAQVDADANRLRAEVTRLVSGSAGKGGILAVLRRSPLVGSDLKTPRPVEAGREVDL